MGENDKDLEVATFRFGIIADFVTGVRLDYGEKEKLLKDKAKREYKIPYSQATRISRSTIKKWVLDYQQAGNRLDGLKPGGRKDQGQFKSLNESLQMAIKEIKNEKPQLTGVAVVNELRHRKYIGVHDKLNLSVLYRFLNKYELTRPKTVIDRKAFEAGAPNELWQSDVMHGPMVINSDGGKQKKSYLIAILDDHSRLIPHAEFYLSEKLIDFKICLREALKKRGLPQRLYIDNGSCYRALNLEQVTASLGIGIVHTPPYTPQGRGKIERWFRYVRENFLSCCPKKMTLPQLNEQFDDWLLSYHHRKHSTTGMTPIERFQKNLKCVRPAPNALIDYFRFIEFRQVKKDRTFRLNGTVFEAPVELIDQRVEVKFHRESPEEVEIFLDGRNFGKATLLNREVNFKIGRNHRLTSENKENKIPPGELF